MGDNNSNAFLFELRGESPGAAHVISGDLFRIGSDSENELVLRDRQVALYQAEIHIEQNQFTLKNLSLEGTAYLNGEPFRETVLHGGDVLTFGDAVLRFVEPGETFSQEELWKPVGGKQDLLATPLSRFRRAPYLMILTLLALVAVVLIVVSQKGKRKEVVREPQGRIARFKGMVSESERRNMYERALDLLAARRWDEAVYIFEKIRKDTPSYKDLDSLYHNALFEGDARGALDQAKGHLLEGDYAVAKNYLKGISERSVYYREASQLHREIDRHFMDRQILEAEKLLEQKDWAEAKIIASSVLDEQPNNVRARQILRMADLQQGRLEHGRLPYREVRQLEPALKEPVKSTGVVVKPVTKKKKMPPRGTPAWYFQQSVDVYRQGNVDRSVRVLEGLVEKEAGGPKQVEEARARIEDLRQAKYHFERAKAFQREGRHEEAAEQWERFLEKDSRLTGREQGAYFQDASASLSKLYFERGKEAYDRNDLHDAFLFWNMAGQICAKDKEVQKGLQVLADSAKEFYLEGYVIQDVNPDRALKRWQEVLQIVPSGNPYYKKARARFRSEALGKSLPHEEGASSRGLQVAKSPKEIYREGYVLRAFNPDRAVEKWTEVLRVLPPGHPYHKKAEALIRLQEKIP